MRLDARRTDPEASGGVSDGCGRVAAFSPKQLSQECRRILRFPVGPLRSRTSSGDRSGSSLPSISRDRIKTSPMESVTIPRGWFISAAQHESTDLPLVGSSLQTTEGGGIDLFLAVVNPALSPSSQVIYVTYIGGTEDETFGAMTVGANGDVYMTGSTASANFPLANAAQTAIAGTAGLPDAFVLWLSPTQTVTYSTLFGGSELDKGTGDRSWIERLDLDSRQYAIHRFSEYGRFPGLADWRAEHVRGRFRSYQLGQRHGDLLDLHRRHALGRGLRHGAGLRMEPFGWQAAPIPPTFGSRVMPIRASMAATAMPTSLISIRGWERRHCCTRVSWAAAALMKQPAWCWILPA